MRFRHAVVLLVLIQVGSLCAQECVQLQAFSDLGVPVHPGPGRATISHRLPDRSIATRLETDGETGWVHIQSGPVDGWIINRYIGDSVPCPELAGEVPNPVSNESTEYVVACWNLEHFAEGKSRGFPENRSGGPSYPSRVQQDFVAIAAVIEELEMKVVVLSEIHATEAEVEEEDDAFTDIRSPELERLIDILGADKYDYVVGESGGSQHLAILFDTRTVELNASWEMQLPNIKIQRKSIADRQPLVAHFTFKDSSGRRNDLAVVGVHLASGQHLNRNHDRAMQIIQQQLELARAEGWCIPQDENDILILGDFNTNRFDNHREEFWDDMEDHGWDVLADQIGQYSPTRLSGVPLDLRNSRIDYIICTSGNRGLQGDEISEELATVHTELIAGGAEEFRHKASDHLPVTVRVRLTEDSDEAIAVQPRRGALLARRLIEN